MLKTNSKQTRENIKQYIMERFDASSYTEAQPDEWHDIALFILDTFRKEKYSLIQDFRYYGCERAAFLDWCAGLPSVLDTCYFYNRSAVDDLGDILEETQSERNKHSEHDAEVCLTTLIYRTLKAEEIQ